MKLIKLLVAVVWLLCSISFFGNLLQKSASGDGIAVGLMPITLFAAVAATLLGARLIGAFFDFVARASNRFQEGLLPQLIFFRGGVSPAVAARHSEEEALRFYRQVYQYCWPQLTRDRAHRTVQVYRIVSRNQYDWWETIYAQDSQGGGVKPNLAPDRKGRETEESGVTPITVRIGKAVDFTQTKLTLRSI